MPLDERGAVGAGGRAVAFPGLDGDAHAARVCLRGGCGGREALDCEGAGDDEVRVVTVMAVGLEGCVAGWVLA